MFCLVKVWQNDSYYEVLVTLEVNQNIRKLDHMNSTVRSRLKKPDLRKNRDLRKIVATIFPSFIPDKEVHMYVHSIKVY